MRHQLHLTCALLFFAGSAVGQNQPCELDVPVNVVMPAAVLVRNLPQDAFVAHHEKGVIAIRSVNVDTAPRRIVLVVENGKNVNPAARRVETSILRTILTRARVEDSFAFLTAGGPRKELSFGTPRDVLLAAIEELSSPGKVKNQEEFGVQAVLAATSWLQPSRPGDSIIFLTMGIEPHGRSEYSKVAKTLGTAGIRLFGFQLGRLYLSIYTAGVGTTAYGRMGPTARIDPNRETAYDLADETGGFFLGENTEGDPQTTYHLTDERIELLNKFAGQLYKGIVEYYRIRLVAAPEDFAIDLSGSVRQKLLNAHLVYPRIIQPCSSAGGATPSSPSSGIR